LFRFSYTFVHGQDGYLYVGNTDAVVRYPFQVGQLRITSPEEVIAPLPKRGYNNHWTRNLLDNGPGSILVTVGSASNIGEYGPAEDFNRSAVLELDLATRALRIYTAGIRSHYWRCFFFPIFYF
jgi:glucose/arabinose dehydrogenase